MAWLADAHRGGNHRAIPSATHRSTRKRASARSRFPRSFSSRAIASACPRSASTTSGLPISISTCRAYHQAEAALRPRARSRANFFFAHRAAAYDLSASARISLSRSASPAVAG